MRGKQREKPRRRGFFTWLSGSIRRKMTLFVVLVCLLLVGLVWLLLIQLLEPAYNYSIRIDLERTVDQMLGLLEESGDEGLLYTERYTYDGVAGEYYSLAYVYFLEDALVEGRLKVSERSIDVADENLACRYFYDAIADSVLHPAREGAYAWELNKLINGPYVVQLRSYLREHGSLYTVLDNGQMVVGKLSDDGRHTVIVSANLERTAQSVTVLKALLMPVSVLLVIVAVVCAWLFSRWFSGPLRRLSGAAREMAHGNYDIRVAGEGSDEIAELAQDFNYMAAEVGRSYSLQRDLIANVSHDLRTPLTLIKGYAETVRDLTGDDKPRRDEQLDVIVDEADRLSALVGRVMEFSRVSSGQEKPEPVCFDLAQLCEEVGERYAAYCAQNGLQFEFYTDGECPVKADPGLTERALHNLLGNAMAHAGPDGYIGLLVRRTGAGRARVEVVDHGAGIEPEDLPHIFERYYRSRADAGKPGTGLGLSITKAIFSAQGMPFGVESAPGEGAVFWFECRLQET